MAFDSIANSPIPAAAANSKDLAKKKRGNRTAKLKQCKLDARREQWLSQVMKKGGNEEKNGEGEAPVLPTQVNKDRDRPSMIKLEIGSRGEKSEELMNHFSDSDSPSNSPSSHISSVLGNNTSGTSFTGSSRSNSSIGSSTDFCSGSITEEEGDDGCLDDWEAVADALAADEGNRASPNVKSEPMKHANVNRVESTQTPEIESGGTVSMGPDNYVAKMNCRAWRPDDASRPQSLPNLLKQRSFPVKADRRYGLGGAAWVPKIVLSAPSSCPICCEDLDLTDSSFLPCLCGFRLCLFCHKRILEEDGRCPGCRKKYEQPIVTDAISCEGNLAFRLGRSCSMINRS